MDLFLVMLSEGNIDIDSNVEAKLRRFDGMLDS